MMTGAQSGVTAVDIVTLGGLLYVRPDQTCSESVLKVARYMKFYRYHALGNDYIVMDAAVFGPSISEDRVRRVCHRHFGIGSDGILLHESISEPGHFSLRIMNPDGSEAEKSGNGLRIYARFLYDHGLVNQDAFTVRTLGGVVTCHVRDNGKSVKVDMGRVSFFSNQIPVVGPRREVLRETLEAGGRSFSFCAATVGNPHCVILDSDCSPEIAGRFGPLIEHHPNFPNRTNVQFLEVIDRNRIRLEIWERGAGYTLASGSSSSAAAAVAKKLGLVDSQVQVHMPGGDILIELDDDYGVHMTGPVTRIASGVLDPECLD